MQARSDHPAGNRHKRFDPQLSARFYRTPLERPFQFVDFLKDDLTLGEIGLSILGQIQATRRAIEQPYTQMTLKIGNSL